MKVANPLPVIFQTNLRLLCKVPVISKFAYMFNIMMKYCLFERNMTDCDAKHCQSLCENYDKRNSEYPV